MTKAQMIQELIFGVELAAVSSAGTKYPTKPADGKLFLALACCSEEEIKTIYAKAKNQ